MYVLVFDTETTGLPESKILNPDTLNKWPYIVQLSYIIYDTSLNTMVETKDFIIKLPEGRNIPEGSTKIHGITNEISKSKGIPIEEALVDFFFDLRSSDQIVGHNIAFDINMIKVELLRLICANKSDLSSEDIEKLRETKRDLHYLCNYRNVYCTMKETIELCNIKAIDKFGKTYKKYPKLVELHQILFQTTPSGLHNSLIDILITLRCFIKIKENKDLYTCSSSFRNTMESLQIL
jgi:DNA polymerase III epsilon subunit-like protein